MKKTAIKILVSLFLCMALLFSCFIVADAAIDRIKGDVDGDKKVIISDATFVQNHLAKIEVPFVFVDAVADVDNDGDVTVIDVTEIQQYLAKIDVENSHVGEPVEVFNKTYSLNATLMEGLPGVYEVKAVKGDSMEGENAKTIGIPRIAKQNLDDTPTEDAPAIIIGAANGFETKTGPVEYTMNDGLTEDDIVEPYSKFRHKVIEETVTDADGNKSTHLKPSGFDGSYYIVRVDVSDIIAGKTGYLHVRQESNKALMVLAGMQGGISTGEKGTDDQGKQTEAPHIDQATNHWFVGEKDTGIEVGDSNTSLSYVDVDGNWCVAGTGFSDGMGIMTQVWSLADDGKALKDEKGNYRTTPYIDIVLMSSAKTVAGADAGKTDAPSADVKFSMYVDDTKDYDPGLTYDPTSQDVNHATNVMNKFYRADNFKVENNSTSYLVMGSDLEIDVAVKNQRDEKDVTDYWSLTKALTYPEYDSHVISLICEVPVLEGMTVEGTEDNPRNVIFDVNSFDIQVANNTQTDSAGLTVKNYATLKLTDESNTAGAELAIGNNASMEVESGGTLIIDDSCTLEVEYDAATITQGQEQQQGDPADINNGVITVHGGGKIVNNGVINIEGLEVKPLQPNSQEQEQQQAVVTDMKASCILVEQDGVIDNYGCLSLKGNLYVLGTLNNYGKYGEFISAQDPDKGTINYHKGIQLTWKDDVTVLDEATNTYSVNPDVAPGALFIGMDAQGNKVSTAKMNNYGDMVLVPGVLNIYAEFNNLRGGEVEYVGGLYVCEVTEAVVPITPDPNDPTKTEERRQLNEPYPSVINLDPEAVVNNQGIVAEAKVEVLSNGILGDMIVVKQIEI